MLPTPPSGKLVGTTFQAGKLAKHINAPLTTNAPVVGVFPTTSTAAYRSYALSAMEYGSVVIDHRGPSVIQGTTAQTGDRFERGVFVRPTDAVKVVLVADPSRVHAYPVNSTIYSTYACNECSGPIV
jgi:hypothetical protein